MLAFQLSRELRAFWLAPARCLLLLAYGLLIAWAVGTGVQWQLQTEAVLSETPGDLLTERSEWMEQLREAQAGGDVSPYSARPMNLTFLAVQPAGSLAALSYRNDAIHPHTALISGWRSEASLFRRYEVEGASALAAGRIDLAFIVITILPLLVVMLSFDSLSRESESGRLRLFLTQGGRASSLVVARLITVAVPVLALPSMAVLAAAVILQAPFANAGLWLLGLAVYTVFWSAVAALIAVAFRRVASGALAAISVWALIVVGLPSGTRFAAEAFNPVPSRVAYLTQARLAEGETRRNLSERADIYMAEHPGQSDAPDAAVPGFYRASFLANVDINDRTAPMVAQFEEQQSRQRRFAQNLQFVSPALSLQLLLDGVSQAGPARAASFRAQTRDHLGVVLAAIGPATVNRSRISVSQAEAIPEFVFTEQGLPSTSHWALLWFLALAGMVGLIARQWSRRVA